MFWKKNVPMFVTFILSKHDFRSSYVVSVRPKIAILLEKMYKLTCHDMTVISLYDLCIVCYNISL